MGKLSVISVILSVLVSISISAATLPAYAGGKTLVNLNPESRIPGKLIVLGDIARIEGEDPLLVERIASTVIGRAPLPKQIRLIDPQQIRLRLKQRGIPIEEVVFQSPAMVKVQRDYAEVTGEAVERLVREFILKEMPWDREQVNISDIHYNETVILPRGKITYQVLPRANEDYLGRTPISVLFKVDGSPRKRVWLSPEVQVFMPVVLSSRPMPRYHLVKRADLRMERQNLERLPSDVLTDPAQAVGKRIRTALAANRPLRADMLAFPLMVKKGDIVVVILESDQIKVSTLGMVKENGKRGDTVKVMNIVSRKEIYGRVVDPKTIKVNHPFSN